MVSLYLNLNLISSNPTCYLKGKSCSTPLTYHLHILPPIAKVHTLLLGLILSLSLSLSLSLYYQFKNPNRPRLPTTFSFVESDPLPMLSSEHSLGRSCIRSALSIIQSENSGDAAHSVIACRVESRVKSSHSFFVNFFRFRTLWKVE
jgi:hypothetical protein